MMGQFIQLYRGHLLRWFIILAAALFLFRIHYSANPWTPEGVVSEALLGMEMPPAQIHTMIESGDGNYAVLLYDEEHGLFHQMYMSRSLGLFWENRGGGFGSELKPDTLLSFKMGMSTLKQRRHYCFMGQVRDPNVTRLRVVWPDGLEQMTEPRDHLYMVTRAYSVKDPASENAWDSKLYAYDSSGKQLYELTSQNTEVMRQP
ncbi:hypothetical protein [Paenibacillus sp. UNC451MF]|uniref:hypothetical protein n=1 Tax=Paenibacillus sp. UNC451MF TaxID=1449063 RepID=UPI00048BDD7B|nr:hypothetical protein [Paenibacillus sp. UNC451MF]